MNPNRYRPQDDFGRRDHDDRGWEARDRRYDEGRSWTEGDGGRTADAWRDQGRDDRYASGGRGWGSGQDRPGDYRTGDYRTGPSSQGRGYDYSGQGYGDHGRGYGAGHRQRPDYPDHGYAPGAQIWEGSGPGLNGERREDRSRHDFEPDYLHWRDQQVSAFDRDYHDWRSERREKFSADFDNWRSSRPKVQAENPIVGDVTDGGTGDASELKKR